MDGDTDLTISSSGTQMGSTSAVNNSTGSTMDVDHSQIIFSTHPPDSAFTNTDFTGSIVVSAVDANENVDVDFSENITLSAVLASNNSTPGSGTLSSTDSGGLTKSPTNGVATWTDTRYDTEEMIDIKAVSASTYTTGIYSTAVTVTEPTSDTDSAVEIHGGGAQANFNLNPLNDTAGEKFSVLKFQVSDKATNDAFATLIDQVTVNITGTAGNASTDIAWAELWDDTGNAQVATSASITDSAITFGSAPDGGGTAALDTVANGQTVRYTVNVYMKNSQLTGTDSQTYIFSINDSDIGEDSNAAVSSQMRSDAGAVSNVTGTITVTHSQIIFSTQPPSTATANTDFTGSIVVSAVDANNNVDKDFSENITLSAVLASNNSTPGSGTLSSTDSGGLTKSPTNGVATWTDTKYNAVETIDIKAVSVSTYTSGIYSTAVEVSGITWNGGSGSWSDDANWDTGSVPGEDDPVVIPDTSGMDAPTLDQATTIKSLTISTNGELKLDGNNLTVSTDITGNGTLTAKGSETISVGGNWDFSGGTFTCASSNVTFNGSGNCTLDAGANEFRTLTVNMANATDTVKVINNPLIIGANTLIIQNGVTEITIDSTFNEDIEVKDGGTFLCRTSLVTLTFAAGINFTVESGGTLTLNGQAFDKEIKLRSATAGSRWNLILQSGGSQDMQYIDVRDSDASGGNTALASFSKDLGNNLNWSFLGGVVYDSQTGDRIKEALVTLHKADSTIYTGSPQPNPQTTDAQGRFFFEVAAGKYYLEARHKDYKDYRGSAFTVSGSSVNENISMDPLDVKATQYLSIAKTVDKKTATIGDILTYTINVKNIDSTLTASAVTITDALPHDFKYVDNTSILDGGIVADPANKRRPSWSAGTLTPKQSRTLSYRVIAGPDAKLGKNKNSATVTAMVSGSSTSAGPSIAVVDIKEGLFSKKGMIIGKVFDDFDQDGIQDMDEKGLAYVALILEDGTMVTTDEWGRFSIPDVSQGMHVLRLDQRMLPGGPLTKEGVGAAGKKDRKQKQSRKEEKLIQRRSLGTWIKDSLHKKGQMQEEKFKGEQKGPRYRSDVPEASTFVQVAESGMAKCNFPVRLLTSKEEELQRQRHAKETQFMVVGIADGTLGYLQSNGKVENISEGDNIGMSLEVDNRFYADGKVVLYAKGKIKGQYLLTTRYDSTREYHDHLYSWINPEKYYPIYGDESVLTSDADSQGKFFIRIDKDASYAMLGNYKTDEFTKTELTKYDRILHGIDATIQGKGKLSLFGAKTLQEERQDIFTGRGISGPYYLTRIPLLEETETVKIEVRDKSRYDVVLDVETKSRDIDYEIDYDTGRLMFREPVPTYDENNDPVYVVCDYEYVPSLEEDKYYIIGSRGELTLFDDKLKLGTQVINEDREGYFYNLAGIDSVWQLSPNTTVTGEWAYSRRTGEREKGQALKIEGLSSLYDNKLKVQTYYSQIGKDFLNPVNVTERGLQKYGLTGELELAKDMSLITDHWMSRSIASRIYDRQTKADFIYEGDKTFLSTGYGYDETIDEKNAIDDIHRHEITLKGGTKITDNIVASGEYSWQRELYKDKYKKSINALSPRLDIKVDENTSLYTRHDYTREKTRGTDKSLTNNVSSIGITTAKDQRRSYIEYGFLGGRMDHTTFGTEEDISINDRVDLTAYANQVIARDKNEENIGYNSKVKLFKDFYLGGAFERTRTTGDTDYEATAVSLAADWLKDKDTAWGTKFEFRHDKTKEEYNFGTDLKWDIDNATYFIAKAEYYKERDWKNKENLSKIERIVGGIGYRPTDNDKLNLLTKYEYKNNLDNTSISKSNYTWHVGSIEGIYDITPCLEFFGKYALKGALDKASGIRTHSLTDLKTLKFTYKFNSYFDTAIIYRAMQNYNTNILKQGTAAEAGITVFDHFRIGAGFNFLDYSDEEYPDEDYQGIGPYIQVTYKFLDDATELLESREEKLKRLADEYALQLYQISRIPGDEKFVEEINACYAQAMEWYKFEKYEEALECLHQGLEVYYAAKRYEDRAKAKEEEFLFYLKQGEKLYEYDLKDKAFAYLEKAYEINAYDDNLLQLMMQVRDEIREERARRRKVLSMKLAGIERISAEKDDTKLVLKTVKLHLEVGKEFYSIGDYKSAISEWKEGLALAERAAEDYFAMEEEREILVNELESIYDMAFLHWKRNNYLKSKNELEKGLKLIGKNLD
ncbi:MAG: DUF11 domain-containing protein [Candidatus Omnitrophota bacterium]|nr:MAG: DUF11 domain-containing protein [Candidatus Omnitrophota bacterium]